MFYRTSLLILLVFAVFALMLTILSGCGYEPDTSAPDRPEVERLDDWRGALLFMADENGPTQDWGSIRVYDNVSGLVEKTVEQTHAAAPADMFVTADQSSMYVASRANGLIDKFRWDGNNWLRGGVIIETPASSLVAIRMGPDGRLYVIDGSPGTAAGRIYTLDPATDRLSKNAITITSLAKISGLAWTADGSAAFVAGRQAGSDTLLLVSVAWPGAEAVWTVSLPMTASHQVLTSPDGRFVYVMGRGEVLKVDAFSGAVISSLRPTSEPETEYVDADFSADGKFLFVTGTPLGSDSNLYIIDLGTGAAVNIVKHIGAKANGIQRVE